MTLNGEMALILRYFTEFGSFRAHCVKVVGSAITIDNLRLLCLVVNVCRETARRPRYKYSITVWWKFCSRFINSRIKYVCDIVVKSSFSLSHLLMGSCFFLRQTFARSRVSRHIAVIYGVTVNAYYTLSVIEVGSPRGVALPVCRRRRFKASLIDRTIGQCLGR